MQDLGLVSALRTHLANLEDTDGLKVNFQVDGERDLSPEHEEGLFRIAQEALNNVSTHAQTDSAAVTLRITGDGASLLIKDQGVGFDYASQSPAGEGFGLTGMRERVNILGGDLEIRSSPGEGTSILVNVPRANGGGADG